MLFFSHQATRRKATRRHHFVFCVAWGFYDICSSKILYTIGCFSSGVGKFLITALHLSLHSSSNNIYVNIMQLIQFHFQSRKIEFPHSVHKAETLILNHGLCISESIVPPDWFYFFINAPKPASTKFWVHDGNAWSLSPQQYLRRISNISCLQEMLEHDLGCVPSKKRNFFVENVVGFISNNNNPTTVRGF